MPDPFKRPAVVNGKTFTPMRVCVWLSEDGEIMLEGDGADMAKVANAMQVALSSTVKPEPVR